jgi:hypothetical protein
MSFGSRLHRDDRRRRVLSDTAAETPPKPRRPTRRGRGRAEKSCHYASGEFLKRQPRWIDLIPTRPHTLLGLAALGGGIVAGLVQLHLCLPRLVAMTGEPLSSLELAGRGTLGAWFASMLLAVSAVMAVIVYTIRRHRRDDYRGRYRIWLWAAFAWLLLSAETATGMRHDFARIVATLSGTPLFGDGAVWWVIPYGFFVGGIGTRLLVDMRHGRLSSLVFLLAAAAFCGSIALRLTGEPVDDPLKHVLLRQGGMLVGSLLVLLSMVLHARYVLLDAQGRLRDDAEDDGEPASGTATSEGAEKTAEPKRAEVTIHPPHPVARPKLVLGGAKPAAPQATPASSPAGKATAATTGRQSPASTPASGELSPVNRKLTKQEKRVLRERLAKARAEREKK